VPHGNFHRIEVPGSIGVVGEDAECGKVDRVGSRTAVPTA
jgi:hypothetical protein